jgi:MFS family permease
MGAAATSTQAETAPTTRATLSIGILAVCGLLVSLLQTMVVPLIPQIPALFSVSPSSATWLLTATLLAGAVSAPVLGRLGDMYGKRRILLFSLVLILVSSIIAATAVQFAVLVLARALQGVSFGVIALGMSLMRDVLPADRVGSGVGLMSSSLGIGGSIGPPLTGIIAQNASWRLLFVAVVVGALVLVGLVLRYVPESRLRTGGRFDTTGAILLSLALVGLLLAVSKGAEWGWANPRTLGLLGAAAVLLAIWGRFELGRANPLVDLRISARPVVLWTNVTTVLLGFSIFAISASPPRCCRRRLPRATAMGSRCSPPACSCFPSAARWWSSRRCPRGCPRRGGRARRSRWGPGCWSPETSGSHYCPDRSGCSSAPRRSGRWALRSPTRPCRC